MNVLSSLSIVIPAYNEQARLGPTVAKLAAMLPHLATRAEILIVDDGSTDRTLAVAEELRRRLETRSLAVRIVTYTPNRGKGHAVRVGMLRARGELVVMSDADGSMPASELPKLLAPLLLGEADVVLGSRYAPGASAEVRQPWFRRVWSRMCNRVVQRLLVPGVADTQCGFKAFRRDAARRLFLGCQTQGWAFDLEILASAQQMGLRIVEVGVLWRDDRRSRVAPLRDALGVLGEAWRIRQRLGRPTALVGDGQVAPTRSFSGPVALARPNCDT